MAILNNINSSSPRAWDIFPFLCIIFSFLHQCFYSFQTLYFTSLIKFILWYFILFDLWLSWNSHISSVQSRPTLCNPMDCSLPGSSIHGIFPGKNTEVGYHFLLQGIFLTHGSNLGLLHCRQTLYHLSHQGSQVHIYWPIIISTWFRLVVI